MDKRYIYIIFFLLGISVIVALFLLFSYIKDPNLHTENSTLKETNVDGTYKIDSDIQDTWLGQINNRYDRNSYFYAVYEIKVELN